MILTHSLRTTPYITLKEPLTRDELIERVYLDGQRLIGRVGMQISDFFELCGTEECEAKIVERFIGDARIHPGSLMFFPSDNSNALGLVIVVELHVDIEHLGVDWDHIDDDTPVSTNPEDPTTRSGHRYTGRSIGRPESW